MSFFAPDEESCITADNRLNKGNRKPNEWTKNKNSSKGKWTQEEDRSVIHTGDPQRTNFVLRTPCTTSSSPSSSSSQPYTCPHSPLLIRSTAAVVSLRYSPSLLLNKIQMTNCANTRSTNVPVTRDSNKCRAPGGCISDFGGQCIIPCAVRLSFYIPSRSQSEAECTDYQNPWEQRRQAPPPSRYRHYGRGVFGTITYEVIQIAILETPTLFFPFLFFLCSLKGLFVVVWLTDEFSSSSKELLEVPL
ncbi:hypothetical protein Tco_0522554 [Tanacetum coccineum]